VNLLLLEDADFLAPGRACVSGRRFRHTLDVHRVKAGDTLLAGRLGGLVGTGVVERIESERLEIAVELVDPPPPKLPITVVLALPRPKVLSRVVADMTSLGVSRIVLVNSWRVEKSYWASPALSDDALREACILGLEQARDTVLPELRIERFFQPFVHGRLAALAADSGRYVAHPGAAPAPRDAVGPLVLAVGPEGGWIARELESFRREGFQEIGLGPRPLRVETAVTALIARLCS
jgi:RsmE family RNA methyltransferase